MSCLRHGEQVDIRSNAAVKNYLHDHKIYVSLTTSPERLKHISTILRAVDLDLVSGIFVVLPEKFKNKDPYPDPLPNDLVNFPKTTILRPSTDMGPATKIVPAIEYVNIDSLSIVISVDDDTVYPVGIFGALASFLIEHHAKVAGGIGGPSGAWHLHSTKVSFRDFCEMEDFCDVLEGFGAIAYVAEAFPVQMVKKFVEASRECKLGDDIVINYAFERNGIERFKIHPKYFLGLVQLYYGFGADSLHQQNTYRTSYQNCVEKMDEL